jgi:hypothetical protein
VVARNGSLFLDVLALRDETPTNTFLTCGHDSRRLTGAFSANQRKLRIPAIVIAQSEGS